MDELIVWLNVASWLLIAAWYAGLRRYQQTLLDWHAAVKAEAEQVEADTRLATDLIVTALWHLEGNKDTE